MLISLPSDPYPDHMNLIHRNLAVVLLLLLALPCAAHNSSVPASVMLEKKRAVALRTNDHISVDGRLEEASWQSAFPAGEFIIYNPHNGLPSQYRTEVRVLYDDDALYIGAVMYDSCPDSIFTHLGQRDDQGINADHFWVEISPFNDGLNGEMFKVSASNVQIDNKMSTTERFDFVDTWDAVWESATSVNSEGWVAELKIPYSALRFPRSATQLWGINFWREVRRNRETSSWNFVTKEFGTSIAHLGELDGISDVKPPLRLSLVPYVSGYVEHLSGGGTATSYNGGLDLKLGLSESFTLDATLIPDFGQVQSDDHVLNLSPYEVQYNEKRPFFMEGTELFNRGRIFYSRRIGGTPRLAGLVSSMVGADEVVIRNPVEVSLLNATKISGRTRGGLGIGFFNALTSNTWATVENLVTGATRQIMTEPLTNYNMIVLDQTLKNDSYVSLMNTSVIRSGYKDQFFYTANVSGFEALVKSADRLWSASAGAVMSQKYYSEDPAALGHSVNLMAGKTGGKFRTGYSLSIMSDTYDPTDMGYLRRNNEIQHSINFSYNTFAPMGNIMSTFSMLDISYRQLYNPRAFSGAGIMLNQMLMLMNYWTFFINMELNPWGEDDYFEPRTWDMSMFFHRPPSIKAGLRGDTDRSKRFYLDWNLFLTGSWSEYRQRGYMWSLGPEVKVGRHFSFKYTLGADRMSNDIGFVYNSPTEGITFGKRDVTTITNTLSGAYIFTARSYLTLRARHYWSRADYDGDYFILQSDGSLLDRPFSTPAGNHDVNTNFLNIDMVYTWRFAPGSELSLVWKNSITSFDDQITDNGFDNFREMLSKPQTNSISLKVLYYLDYQNFRKLFRGR